LAPSIASKFEVTVALVFSVLVAKWTGVLSTLARQNQTTRWPWALFAHWHHFLYVDGSTMIQLRKKIMNYFIIFNGCGKI